MARRRVTYEHGGSPVPAPRDAVVSLGPPPSPPAPRVRRPPRRRWPLVAGAALVGALALGQVDRTPPAPDDPGEVVAGPWRGTVQRHPGDGGTVPRVHVIALARPDGSAGAVAVVDATRRAFGNRRQPAPGPTPQVRVLGVDGGTGVRTWQWDEAGYGIALTTVGLTTDEQRRLAIALDVPGGPSLRSGRVPTVDLPALGRLGMRVTEVASGPASASGAGAIGAGGGASGDGVLRDGRGRAASVTVVRSPVAGADRLRRALGPVATSPRVPGARATAAISHPGTPAEDDRIRGWHRVLVDLPGGATAVLASDEVGPTGLAALASALDLAALAEG